MKLADRRSRLEPELLVQPLPDRRVVLESIGLATAAVEGQHRQLVRVLS